MSCLYVVWDVIGNQSHLLSISELDLTALCHDRRYYQAQSELVRCICIRSRLWMLSIPRSVYESCPYPFSKLIIFCVCCAMHAVWGVLWLVIALIFFAAGIIVGLVAFKESAAQQKKDASKFLPVPGSTNAASVPSIPSALAMMGLVASSVLF